MAEPKISVVIPVYNGLPYVQRTIESVLAQDYRAHEVIVINDGSADGTEEELKRYKDKILLKTIRNSGVAAARNTGIHLATGDYIALLDADDVWFKNKLKKVVEFIMRNPEVGFICSNYVVRYAEFGHRLCKQYSIQPGFKYFNFDTPLQRNPFEMLLLYGNFVGTPSAAVFKKKIAEEFGFFKLQHRIVEDFEFFLDMAMRTPFLIIREPLFYKRTHDTNMSNDKLNMYLGHKDALESVLISEKNFIEKNHLRPAFSVALAEVNYKIGNQYFEVRNRQKAFLAYWEALRSNATIKNFIDYLWIVSKKSLRLLTCNKISRKNFDARRL